MSEPRPAPSGLGATPFWVLAALCAVLLAAQFAFPGEGPLGRLGLPALAGLVAAGAVGLLAAALRPLLSRPEDYYDR